MEDDMTPQKKTTRELLGTPTRAKGSDTENRPIQLKSGNTDAKSVQSVSTHSVSSRVGVKTGNNIVAHQSEQQLVDEYVKALYDQHAYTITERKRKCIEGIQPAPKCQTDNGRRTTAVKFKLGMWGPRGGKIVQYLNECTFEASISNITWLTYIGWLYRGNEMFSFKRELPRWTVRKANIQLKTLKEFIEKSGENDSIERRARSKAVITFLYHQIAEVFYFQYSMVDIYRDMESKRLLNDDFAHIEDLMSSLMELYAQLSASDKANARSGRDGNRVMGTMLRCIERHCKNGKQMRRTLLKEIDHVTQKMQMEAWK